MDQGTDILFQGFKPEAVRGEKEKWSEEVS